MTRAQWRSGIRLSWLERGHALPCVRTYVRMKRGPTQHQTDESIFQNLDKSFSLPFFLFARSSHSYVVTDNEFICDCRLGWIFDLKNRTKNFELRYSLEEIECMLKTKDRPTGARIKVNVDDVMKKQILNDDTEYYEDESYDEKRTTQLVQFKQKELPCPQQYREQLEHPSTREFIGFDLSWIHSSATRTTNSNFKSVSLFLALITHCACTLLAAFFR